MDTLLLIFFLILGTIIGSFLNVVIYRLGSGMTLGGRSMCLLCSRTLTWYELIPGLSYIILRGKCRTCSSRISPQYPLVEVGTGILFALSFFTFNLGIKLIFALVISALLVVLIVYDLRHKILPDVIVFPFVLIALISALWEYFTFPPTPLLWVLLSGPLVAFPLFLIWFFSKGRAMGFGDVKFALGMGWLLGILGGFSALIFAFWVGALVALTLLFYGKVVNRGRLSKGGGGLTMKSEIAFGPFLVLGTFLVYLFDVTLLSFF